MTKAGIDFNYGFTGPNESPLTSWAGSTRMPTLEVQPHVRLGMDVIYVMPDGRLRSAKVVNRNTSSEGHCNLTVFLDGMADSYSNASLIAFGARNIGGGCIAVSSAGYSGKGQRGTWHVERA